MNRQYVIGGALVVAVMVLAGLGVGVAHADTNPTSTVSKMAQAIADKFHLNASDVQSTMDQERQTLRQQRQDALKAKLDQAVKDGKLTQDQENTLLQKLQTRTQDKQAMRQSRRDLRQWLEGQNLDLRSILGAPGEAGQMGIK